MANKMTGLDIGVVVVYFLCVILIGFWAMYRSNRGTVKGYFLAGQSMIWLPVGASLFASNIGSEHFIGLAGSGAAKGIGVGAFELNASFMLHMLGWIFLPVYINSGAQTLPEYMTKRFGGKRIQCYLAVISILLYIFTKISVNLYAASLFIYEAVQLNLWISVFLLLTMTGLITITGGLAAVLYTDTFQCIFMVIGSVILAIISFAKVGGITGLFEQYGNASAFVSPENYSAIMNNSHLLSCYLPSKKSLQMLRPISDDDMPWLGFLFGQTPASIWYWCADQMMVQRALSAKNIIHAKGGTLIAGVIKLFPLFIMVMPGMISRILFPNEVACATIDDCMRVCGQASGCSNLAYPKLVMELLPQGVRGLMLSVMLAALVSDLTSIFNSASTLFTVDIYRIIRKTAKERELLIVGRLFVMVMIGLSLLWLPVIQNMQGGQLFIYIQSISGYLAPPIAAVYLMAIFVPFINEKGAMVSLVYGFIIGTIKMVIDIVWRSQPCQVVDKRPLIVRKFHYMYFALFSFVSCLLIMLIVSRLTKKNVFRTYKNITFWDYLKRNQINNVNVTNAKRNMNQQMPMHPIPGETEVADQPIIEEKVDDESDNSADSPATKSSGITMFCRHIWTVFLGLKTSEEPSDDSSAQMSPHDIKVWLHEGKLVKYIMTGFMLLSVTVVVSIYILFSVMYPEIKVGPLRVFNSTGIINM